MEHQGNQASFAKSKYKVRQLWEIQHVMKIITNIQTGNMQKITKTNTAGREREGRRAIIYAWPTAAKVPSLPKRRVQDQAAPNHDSRFVS